MRRLIQNHLLYSKSNHSHLDAKILDEAILTKSARVVAWFCCNSKEFVIQKAFPQFHLQNHLSKSFLSVSQQQSICVSPESLQRREADVLQHLFLPDKATWYAPKHQTLLYPHQSKEVDYQQIFLDSQSLSNDTHD